MIGIEERAEGEEEGSREEGRGGGGGGGSSSGGKDAFAYLIQEED